MIIILTFVFAKARFGGWQNASDSDSSEEDSGEDRGGGGSSDDDGAGQELDAQAQAALEELRVLAVSAQEAASEQRPVLTRHDTPFGALGEEPLAPFDAGRLQENGNSYGTPPPQEE